MAVLAHETGHVVGGHLARLKETMRIAQRTTLLTSILGGIAAVASQRPDVGVAVMVGSQGSIMGSVSTYRISEENSADKIAVDLLIKTNQSLKGMVDIMKLLDKESRLYPDYEFEYYRTHPITGDRIAFFENMYEKHKDLKVNQEYEVKFSRIKAKLFAFLGDKERVYNIVKGRKDIDSLYALAIYYLRINNVDNAIKTIDMVISIEPNNPYFYELKGQIYFENGKIKESIAPYKKALSLKPDNNLIITMLSMAELEEGSNNDLKQISESLAKVVIKEKYDPFIWRIYASCYKRLKDEAKYSYGMAEYNFLVGNNEIALYHANKALKDVGEGTPMWFNIQDIISTINDSNKNKKGDL
ncbi:MAG: TPR repeat-containing protein YfgC precursor [Alphaproteobacteria bacterium ADurb.Bin438]|nr:MAG: TPR repeat-containing protein YfgC precursor [Alphaproteobacteria bacterium ADurb.Bin438]